MQASPHTWRNNAARRLGYSTAEAARILHVQPQTLRAALCRDGHYLGVQPRKLANRLLDWGADEIDGLASGEVAA